RRHAFARRIASEPHPRQRAQLRIEGKKRPWIEIAARIDHHRVRKLARGGGEKPQRECELAASSTPGQEREPPTGQARNSGQAIERRMAGPGLRGRQFRRPRQRLAAKADPNRIDGVFELLHFLHLSLRASESKTQARSGGGYRLTNICSLVKPLPFFMPTLHWRQYPGPDFVSPPTSSPVGPRRRRAHPSWPSYE